MVGWHVFEQTLGDSEEQGSLACCRLRGCKQLDMTEQLNKKQQLVEHKAENGSFHGECLHEKVQSPIIQIIPRPKLKYFTRISN